MPDVRGCRRRVVLAVCLAAPALMRPGSAFGDGDVLDIPALMRAMAAVPEHHQRFREERRFAALNFPLIVTGTLHYWRPDRIERWIEAPEREVLAVNGDRIELTIGNEPTQHISLGRAPEMRVLVNAFRAPLSGDLATLRQTFRADGTGGPAGWMLRLQPLEPRAARFLREVRLSGVAAEVRRTVWMQGNGDEYVMQTEPLS